MRTSLEPSHISPSTLHDKFAAYNDTIPIDLRALSKSRYKIIPNALAQRKRDCTSSNDSTSKKKKQIYTPSLERSELISLVDWKLKHGTYRPNLAKLIASNTPSNVQEVTRCAFMMYDGKHNSTPGPSRDYRSAMRELVKLKGVGPATASLVLACWDPEAVVFMGDEVFRWILFNSGKDDTGGDSKKGTGKGKAKRMGWERKIGYTVKEYQLLFERCEELRARLAGLLKTVKGKREKDLEKVTAAEVERAAYVIHREDTAGSVSGWKRGRSDNGAGADAEENMKEEEDGEDDQEEPKSKKNKKTT